MDPARAGPGGARQGAAVQGPARRAHRLDPADPRHALPPGRARAARGVLAAGNRAALEAGAGLSPAGAQAVTVALRQIDRLDTEIDALLAEIRSLGRDPARLQGVAAPVRDRQAHRRDHLGRAWPHAPV